MIFSTQIRCTRCAIACDSAAAGALRQTQSIPKCLIIALQNDQRWCDPGGGNTFTGLLRGGVLGVLGLVCFLVCGASTLFPSAPVMCVKTPGIRQLLTLRASLRALIRYYLILNAGANRQHKIHHPHRLSEPDSADTRAGVPGDGPQEKQYSNTRRIQRQRQRNSQNEPGLEEKDMIEQSP